MQVTFIRSSLVTRLVFASMIVCMLCPGCIPTYVGTSTLKEVSVSKPGTKIGHVLLAGAGSMSSRVFLESISEEMTRLFAGSGIKCTFTYTGKIPRGAHVDVAGLVAPQYDAYLVLNPSDTAYMDTHKSVGVFATPVGTDVYVTGNIIGNQYKERFMVELYTNKVALSKVWEAALNVNFDVANASRCQKIAKSIYDRLVKNGFVPAR